MAIGINDLDFGDDLLAPTPEEQQVSKDVTPQNHQDEPPTPPADNKPAEDEDLVTTLLKQNGIKDPTQIKFENEDGTIVNKDFKDLSREEQLNILTPQQEEDQELSDEELNFINLLRQNNLTPQEYVETLQNQMVQQYSQPQPQTYTVDDYDDDELYVADLKNKVPNLSDDELAQALTQAKTNPDLFKKQVDGLRESYKKLEDQSKQQQEAQAQAEQEAEYQQFQNNIINSINNLNAIGSMDVQLDNDDKTELAQFILGRDQAGVSNLSKAINDPDVLTKMAWFALHGDQLLDDMQDYLSDQVKKARQAGYNEGLVASNKKPTGGGNKPSVVVTNPTHNDSKKHLTINDIDF